MNISSGTIIISTPFMDDVNFEKVVIFITEHNEKGAMGFVINKLFPRKFNELSDFQHSRPFTLFEGGPVESEHLFFLHQCPDLIAGGTHVVASLYLGGDFKQAVAYINDTVTAQDNIKLFIGYCGWDYNQLEEEIQEGSWLVVDTELPAVFSYPTEMLWEEMYKKKDS